MKVGDYVRTKNKGIFKIDERCYFNKDFKEFWFKAPCDYGNEWTTIREVIKSSLNIIDLIGRFDLVNGHLVICKMYEDEKDIPTIIKCVGEYYFKEKDIKSIVTKEQFEAMKYRVEV